MLRRLLSESNHLCSLSLIFRLIGDGVAIEYSDGVDGEINVCLLGRELSNDIATDTQEFPVLDFASSDENYEKLIFCKFNLLF